MPTMPADPTRRDRRILLLVVAITFPIFLAIVYVLPSLGPVYRIFSVPSTSMVPAVPLGSYAIVSRAAYGYSRHSFDLFQLPITGRWPDRALSRGDVAVFRLPRDRKTVYIKRVIGLPGERIQMQKGRLLINGQLVRREPAGQVPHPGEEARGRPVSAYTEHLPEGVTYRIIETDGDTGPFDNTAPYSIPAGHYFVLGDNRDNSTDSRMPWGGVGFVPRELFIGRIAWVVGGASQ